MKKKKKIERSKKIGVDDRGDEEGNIRKVDYGKE